MKRSAKSSRSISVLSLFSGGGGLDLGFFLAGFDIRFKTDVERVFCDTLEANKPKYVNPKAKIHCGDIRELEFGKERFDLVIGGPPCQSFSASGRRAGGAAGTLDNRGNLFEAYCRILKQTKAKAFLFENVRGILGTNKGRDWEQIKKAFESLGYNLDYRILDACDYGIPQHRERLILVGHKKDVSFLFPTPSHGPDSPDNVPHLTPSVAFKGVSHEEDVTKLILTDGRYSALLREIPPGDNYLYFTAKRGYPNPVFAYRSRFSDFLYKANPKVSVKTLIASPGKYTGPLHWENRYFSIGEYKRLQGFPDDYIFTGNRSEIIRQIGNSVSPQIAFALAKAVAKQIFGRDEKINLLPKDYRLSFDSRKAKKAVATKRKHVNVAREAKKSPQSFFRFEHYETMVKPYKGKRTNNVFLTTNAGEVNLTVYGDDSNRLFLKMLLLIDNEERNFNKQSSPSSIMVRIKLFGSDAHSVQTAWNAVDDLVERSSHYYSLFELYGHFTEPHPIFSIKELEVFSNHPIARFAKHVSDFSNCSKFFPRQHLSKMFGNVFGKKDFTDLVSILRSFRYDIRCTETNVAIPPNLYMVCYPFTLPQKKQMNFRVKTKIANTDIIQTIENKEAVYA